MRKNRINNKLNNNNYYLRSVIPLSNNNFGDLLAKYINSY